MQAYIYFSSEYAKFQINHFIHISVQAYIYSFFLKKRVLTNR